MIVEAAIAQGLFKLALGISGVLMGRLTLIWMDKSLSSNFNKWLDEADAKTKAIYYSGRFIFVGIIIGAAIS